MGRTCDCFWEKYDEEESVKCWFGGLKCPSKVATPHVRTHNQAAGGHEEGYKGEWLFGRTGPIRAKEVEFLPFNQ